MKSSRGNVSQESFPMLKFDARFMTAVIPVKWRGAVLLTGTVVFFPLIIGVIMLDAVTHDLPVVRTPVKKTLMVISTWIHTWCRVSRARPVADQMRFPELARVRTSLSA